MVILVEILIVVLVAYSAWGWTLYFMQPHFVYRPVKDVPYTPEELGLDFEKVNFAASDGTKLTGWFVPAKNAEFTVLFCHGNGGNIMHRLDSINLLYNLGLNCFIFDYRGYGNSEGIPTEDGTYLDAMAAYNWLIKNKKVQPENIIIFGRSLGAGIAAQLATQVNAASLILESCFTSYVDIGKKIYPYLPVRWFARFNYRSIDYIKQIQIPVMIIHSRNDEIIPFEFGLQIYQAANEPKEFIEIFGGHNDGFLISDQIYKNAWNKWLVFLRQNKKELTLQHAS